MNVGVRRLERQWEQWNVGVIWRRGNRARIDQGRSRVWVGWVIGILLAVSDAVLAAGHRIRCVGVGYFTAWGPLAWDLVSLLRRAII